MTFIRSYWNFVARGERVVSQQFRSRRVRYLSMPDKPDETTTPSLTFKYLKSDGLRVIKADGVHGGLTPRGDIIMSIFSERVPIPEGETYAISEEGGLGKLLERKIETEGGIIREVSAVLSVRPDVAQAMVVWLKDKLEQYEKAVKETADLRGSTGNER